MKHAFSRDPGHEIHKKYVKSAINTLVFYKYVTIHSCILKKIVII